MAAEDRVLKILLQLKADTAGAQQIKTELKAVEAQAAQTMATLQRTTTGGAGRTITDNSIPAAQTAAQLAADAASAERTREILRNRTAVTAVAAQTLVLDGKSVIAAELSAAAEAKKVLQMERQLIIEIQLEAAEARIAGNPALAAKLEREAAIRLQALTIQRATNVSMEIAIAQAERLVLAQEVGNAKAATAMNFTRGQATALAQQLATGRVSAESISRSFSGFGSSLSIAGIAGFALYQVIATAADEAVRLAKESEKEANELFKQVQRWQELAQAAGDFNDIVKLGSDIGPRLAAMSEKLDEFRQRELTWWQTITDAVITFTTARARLGMSGTGFNQSNLDASTKAQEESTRIALVAGNASIDAAQKAKAAWDAVNLLPLNEAIEVYTQKLDDLRAKQSGIDRNASIPEFEEWVKVGKEIELAEKRVEQLTKTQTKLAAETDKVAAGIAKVDFDQLDKGGQLQVLDDRLLKIQDDLQELGVAADSPNEALEKAKTLVPEIAAEVIKLAQAWAAVLGEIVKVTAQQADDRRKAEEKAINDALRERREIMRTLRQEQRAISDDPFLSIADKNARLIPLLLQEAAAHEKAGDAAEAHARKMEALALTFSGDLQANIQAWANSMGTSAQQIGGFITGSINEALQATNQLITDAVFNTGDWRQTVVGLEKAILNMFLSMIEKMILQHVLGETQKATSTVTSVTSAGARLAAETPVAAATSISTSGVSATLGAIAAVAAIAAIIAALSGGFKRGGYTGAGGEDEYAGPAHRGEFYFTKRETENIGLRNLYAWKHSAASAPHFDEGGFVDPDIPPISPPPPSVMPGGFFGHNWNYTPVPPRYYSTPYWSGGNLVGGSLFPGGGNPFAPGGGYHSSFNPYNPFAPGGGYYSSFTPRPDVISGMQRLGYGTVVYNPATNTYVTPGGQVVASFDPSTGGYVTRSGQVVGGYDFPPSIRINPGSDIGGLGFGSVIAYYDPSSGNYITASGQVVASYDPATGTYVTPGGRVVSGIGGGARGPGDRLVAPPPGTRGRNQFYNYGTGRLETLHEPGSFRDSPNQGAEQMGRIRQTTTDAGHNRFNLRGGMRAFRNDEGGFEMVSYNPRAYSDPGLRAWAAYVTSASGRAGAGTPFGQIPHRAAGGLMPGPPSTTDTMLAWLAGNEFVVQSPAVERATHILGPDFLRNFNDMRIPLRFPHFASGGPVGSSSADGGSRIANSGRSNQRPIVNIAYFDDAKKALKWLSSQEGEQILFDVVNRKRHELGLGAVNA